MSALENLTAAVNGLTTTVDQVVEAWHKPSATDEQVQAAADATNAQTDRLKALLVTGGQS